MQRLRLASVACLSIMVIGLAGCSGEVSSIDRAQAQVNAKEKALSEAEAQWAAASESFCQSSKTYILALDRYGDVLNDTAPTVGDVREAGADLAAPGDEAADDAEAAVDAHQQVVVAEQELAEAQAALEQAKTGASAVPAADPQPTATPLVPAAAVDRVKQAQSDLETAQGAITDATPLTEASEQFNSAVVAVEFAWLRLFADGGCLADEQAVQAQATVSAYVTALQQDLADAGHYTGAIDGVYGPDTVSAVEALQEANGLPVTGTVDKATADALQAELLALGGAEAVESVATTAAVQQTLKLVGFWDGPVDGEWTPELTEALKSFQVELGVEPTGTVDAATITAFQAALSELQQPGPSESPSPTPTDSEDP